MVLTKSAAVAVGTALLLASCSFVSDSIFPSRSGRSADSAPLLPSMAATAPTPALPARPGVAPTPPALTAGAIAPVPVTPGVNTGTFVGQKVQQIRTELTQLQTSIVQQNQRLQDVRNQVSATSQRYHGTLAAITSRLQVGTTPGNPVLVNQWNVAQSELDRLSSEINQLNSLANSVASDSAFATFVLESARAAFGLSGAIDEDHRQLVILEDETNRTVVLIDRLLNELSEDVSRQTAYVGNERANLTTVSLAIQNGELIGPSLANRAFSRTASLGAPSAAGIGVGAGDSTAALTNNRRPLVVIRFDRADVPYQQALYAAVSRALEQRPQAAFDLVAVAPNKGTPAEVALNQSRSKGNAERVLRSLVEMGLPANRVQMSSATSGDAFTNEVHLYVR
ncbi:MAG: hypothetical protein EXQ85_08060 [Alphaproteobacteria bacterium]|nr:hypothetical protein [Alphaproteobacteria bacterium]